MSTQEQTITRLRMLKMSAMANAYNLQLDQPQIQQLGFDERLSFMVEAEVSARENRHLKRLVRQATLPEPATIEDVFWKVNRGLEKDLLISLSTCDWIQRRQNVTLVGPTGVGKSWIGSALLNQACRNGITAKWYGMEALLGEIAVATSDGSLPKLKHALSKVEVLALDDFGLGTFNDQASSVLLDVVERRYRAGRALLLTSQFLPEKWHALFPDPTVADAILDRIVHQSHVIQLTGESLRKQKAKGVPLA